MRYNQIKAAQPDKQAGEFQTYVFFFFSFSFVSHYDLLLY